MTPVEFAKEHSLTIINVGEGNERQIEGVYCCDLLSVVMGRAKQNDAWITVMGNINSIAVGVLADVSCIILSEGITLDEQAKQKAKEQDVCVLMSDLPTYEIALKLSKLF